MAVSEAEFRSAILPFTLRQEGGLSVDRQDPGNWTGGAVGKGKLNGTKYGIAASSHLALDIRHLTLAQACDIYWAEYCAGPGFDRLGLPMLQVVFDAGVNCGPARARAWLTLAAAKRGEAEQIRAVSASNLAYHRSLKTWGRYGATWTARIAACEKRAIAVLAAAPVVVPSTSALPHVDAPRAAPRAAVQARANPLVLSLRSLAAAFTAGAQPQGA